MLARPEKSPGEPPEEQDSKVVGGQIEEIKGAGWEPALRELLEGHGEEDQCSTGQPAPPKKSPGLQVEGDIDHESQAAHQAEMAHFIQAGPGVDEIKERTNEAAIRAVDDKRDEGEPSERQGPAQPRRQSDEWWPAGTHNICTHGRAPRSGGFPTTGRTKAPEAPSRAERRRVLAWPPFPGLAPSAGRVGR